MWWGIYFSLYSQCNLGSSPLLLSGIWIRIPSEERNLNIISTKNFNQLKVIIKRIKENSEEHRNSIAGSRYYFQSWEKKSKNKKTWKSTAPCPPTGLDSDTVREGAAHWMMEKSSEVQQVGAAPQLAGPGWWRGSCWPECWWAGPGKQRNSLWDMCP